MERCVSRLRLPPPANDNEAPLAVRLEGLKSPPLTVAEVEIFDALISNIAALTAANDNEAAPLVEKRP
jgi:hypothetical protein